jgi:integrase/recombinase XerC
VRTATERPQAFPARGWAGLGQKETSIARRYSALRSQFFYLEREGIVAKNPASLTVRMKLPPRRPPQFMTKPDRELVLRVLSRRDSRVGRCNYALRPRCTSRACGRASCACELCLLKLADVDLEAATVYVRDGKGRKDRRVPVAPRLVRILRLWITGWRARSVGNDAPWLFLRVTRQHQYAGQPLNPKAIYHIVRSTIVPILGRKVTPDTFRHSYATHLYEERRAQPGEVAARARTQQHYGDLRARHAAE